MLLPQTLTATLIVMILGLLCLGSWAVTLKLSGNWRFELYYFDFALGVLVAALVLAFTTGSIGYDGFQFTDDLMHAGKRQWFYAFVAGVIFNFANMFLTGALSISGLATAFPIGIGFAVVVGTVVSLLLGHPGNPALMLGGSAVMLGALVAGGMAYSGLSVMRHEQQARAGKAKNLMRPSSVKGIVLALAGGLLMGSFSPLVQNAMEGELGLGPYSVSALFAIGVFCSTLVFSIFFINLPVEGEPADLTDYFRARPKWHLLGFLGGALFGGGSTALLAGSVAPATPQQANLGAAANYLFTHGFPLVAALWGVVYFKEFSGSDVKVKSLAAMTIVLYAAGIVLIALAALYVHAVA